MSENNKLITKNQKESKAEITVCQNQNEEGEPFEAVIEFQKPRKPSEVMRGENTIALTVSGKLRLNIGNYGFVEIYAEGSNRPNGAGMDETNEMEKERPNV